MTKTEQIKHLFSDIANTAWEKNNNSWSTGSGDNELVNYNLEILAFIENDQDLFEKLEQLEKFNNGSN